MKHFSSEGCIEMPYDRGFFSHYALEETNDYDRSIFSRDDGYDAMKEYERSIMKHEDDSMFYDAMWD